MVKEQKSTNRQTDTNNILFKYENLVPNESMRVNISTVTSVSTYYIADEGLALETSTFDSNFFIARIVCWLFQIV